MRDGEDADGADALGGFEWACEHCGERTPKHSPPCSNCGGMQFEKVEWSHSAEIEKAESLVPTSRRAFATYGAAGALVVLGGGWMMYREYTEPTVPKMPGDADGALGFSFEVVESEIRESVNAERSTTLEPTASARNAARFANAFTIDRGPDAPERDLYRRVDGFHLGDFRIVRRIIDGEDGSALEQFESESELAAQIAEVWLVVDAYRDAVTDGRFTDGGVDVHHGPDGDVYASMVVGTGEDRLF